MTKDSFIYGLLKVIGATLKLRSKRFIGFLFTLDSTEKE